MPEFDLVSRSGDDQFVARRYVFVSHTRGTRVWTYGRAGFLSSGRGLSTTVFCWPSSTPNRTGGRSGTSSAPSPSRDPVPTTRQQAEAEIKALAGARPGEWVTWKVYDRSRRQLASVAARTCAPAGSPRCADPGCTSTPASPRPRTAASSWRSPTPPRTLPEQGKCTSPRRSVPDRPLRGRRTTARDVGFGTRCGGTAHFRA